MPPKRAPLKFLALHGHAMNPHVFEKRIGAVRSDLKKLGVEFVFGQGPIVPPSDWLGDLPPPPPPPSSSATASEPSAPLRSIGGEKQQQEGDASPVASTSSLGEGQSQSEQAEAVTVYSWFDFWTWRNAQQRKEAGGEKAADASATPASSSPSSDAKAASTTSIAPRYNGCPDALRVFRDLSAAHGPFDGILAFSQGTGAAALWLALEAQELRRMAEGETENNVAGENTKEDQADGLVVGEDIPLAEWRIPPAMRLLRPKLDPTTGAPLPAAAQPPFLLVNVSGVVPRDDEFGTFVAKSLRTLPKSEAALASSSYSSSVSGTTGSSSPLLPLRPLHVLNVFGTSDAVVLPETTRLMNDLYAEACGEGSGEEKEGKETKKRSTEWSHDGGHVVPSALRKPLKALIETLFGK